MSKISLNKGLLSLRKEGQLPSPVLSFSPKHHQLNNSIEFILKANLVLSLVLQMLQNSTHYSKSARKYDNNIQRMTKYTDITIVRWEKTDSRRKAAMPATYTAGPASRSSGEVGKQLTLVSKWHRSPSVGYTQQGLRSARNIIIQIFMGEF